jgi:hypothetical protein
MDVNGLKILPYPFVFENIELSKKYNKQLSIRNNTKKLMNVALVLSSVVFEESKVIIEYLFFVKNIILLLNINFLNFVENLEN